MITFHRKANVLHFHEVKNGVEKARQETMPSINAAKRQSRQMQKGTYKGAYKYVRG
jgi:hypothetical protein